jgi:hypothetical protein
LREGQNDSGAGWGTPPLATSTDKISAPSSGKAVHTSPEQSAGDV